MGVNALAFRAPQHDTLFAADADCVGLTREISWEMNRQWTDWLARSGTPLFVSAAADALGPEQRKVLREAFRRAAVPRTLGEPLDWVMNTEPERWAFEDGPAKYEWFGREDT